MSTRANCRYSSGINDQEKLYVLRDLFDRYGPVARLLLDDFRTDRTESELSVATWAYDEVIEDKLVGFLRTGASFLYEHFNRDDPHQANHPRAGRPRAGRT